MLGKNSELSFRLQFPSQYFTVLSYDNVPCFPASLLSWLTQAAYQFHLLPGSKSQYIYSSTYQSVNYMKRCHCHSGGLLSLWITAKSKTTNTKADKLRATLILHFYLIAKLHETLILSYREQKIHLSCSRSFSGSLAQSGIKLVLKRVWRNKSDLEDIKIFERKYLIKSFCIKNSIFKI